MDAFSFTVSAALLFSFFFSVRFFFRNKHLTNLPPSPPFSLPLLGHLHLLKPPLHRALTSLSTQYGPLLYLHFGSRPTIVVSSPSLAEECLSKSDVIFANRPRLIVGKLIGYNYTAMGFTSYGPHLRNLRRLATGEVLSSHRIQSLSHVREKEVVSMVKCLFRDSNAAGKLKVEFRPRLWELTFNTVMGMMAGKQYYGESAADPEEAKRFHWIMTEFSHLAGVPCVGDFLPWLGWLDLGGLVKRMMTLAPKVNEFVQGLIDEQREKNEKEDQDGLEMSKKKTLIEVLLELQNTEGEYYTDDIVKGFIATILGAGTETSSFAIEWAMALLLNHPHVLKKAKAELEIQVGHDHLLEESDLPNLPYLHCIIHETLRLYPVGPLLLPHQSSEETTVGGFTVPGGTMLLVNAWAIHRDPEAWAEPEKFKPERFENVNIKELGCKYMPFGHGRRACPGAGLAMKVVALGLGSLIQCFDWERIGEAEVDMNQEPGLTMPKAKPLEASCKPCEKMIPILSQL